MIILKSTIKAVLLTSIIIIIALFNTKSAYAVNSLGVWEEVGSISLARSVPGIAQLNSGAIITGGYNGSILDSSEIYNSVSKTWSSTGNLNINRMMAIYPGTVTLSNGNVIIINGEGPNLVEFNSSTELYSAANGIWTLLANSNIGRIRAIVAPLPDNKVLLAGGSVNGGITNTVEIYNANDNTWSPSNSMHIGRKSQQKFTILSDNRILIAGGQSINKYAEDTAEIYNPTTKQWNLSIMPFSQNFGTLTTMKNGKILATGSYDGNTILSSAAIYNPETNMWTPTTSLPAPRAGHSAIMLDDGNILIFGGNNNDGYLKNSAIYNPHTKVWTEGPELPTNFADGAITKLNNGDYLIVGGYDGINHLSNAYIFTNGNNNIDLNVPLLKQTDEPWGPLEYDSASLWNPNDPTISRWGCALTSATMVYNYFGYEKLPGGNILNPENLNGWLNNQPDGYVRNGLVNWIAISRLSLLAIETNSIVDFEALEYIRTGSDTTQLIDNINNNLPGILQEPGHYIVGKGIDQDTFNINDPLYDRDTLNDYDNDFISMGTYTPSSTDLSYMMLVVNEEIDILLKDSSNREVGEQFLQEPIYNHLGPFTSGKTLKMFYLPKPDNGYFDLTLSSTTDQNYQLDVYFYDQQGIVEIQTLNGVISNNNDDTYEIIFNKDEISNSTIILNSSNFYVDLLALLGLEQFKNKGLFNSFTSKFIKQDIAIKDKTKINILKAISNELNAQQGKGISDFAYEYINERIVILNDSL